jgi:hypothetical protein
MLKMLRLFWGIMRDERGVDWWSGKGILWDEDEPEPVPYEELRKKYGTYLTSKLGTSTPYKYNPAFDIAQPEVEKAAESSILGYFKNPKSNVSDYSEATKKYSEATKTSMQETYDKERKEALDRYNRLGLVSSTPGLTEQTEIGERQRTASNLFDTELLYKNLDRQSAAQGLDITQLSSMLGQAGNISAAQRGAQEYGQGMSMADIKRMTGEETDYASLVASLLGQNPEDTSYSPGLGEQLLSTGTNLLPYLLMMM